MRISIALFTIVFFLLSCEKTDVLSLQNTNNHQYIALQPLGNYTQPELAGLQNELSVFFNTRVLILQPVPLPDCSNLHHSNDSYSADSLIHFLLQYKNDSIVDVVGITHKEIYNNEKRIVKINDKDSEVDILNPVFGFGYVKGNACVISDARLASIDKALFNNRLRKVVIHEIGHNMGLQHCTNDECIMSQANSSMVTLNNLGGDYCNKCRRLLK